MQLNRIEQPVYTAVANYSTQSDGSLSVRYIVGTGKSDDVSDFQLLCESWKHIPAEKATILTEQPLTADDLGKSPNQIMLDRIYTHLKEVGEILV